MSNTLPSRFQIGDHVFIRGQVAEVRFAEGKVDYMIVTASHLRISGFDSSDVEPASNPDDTTKPDV